MRFKNIGFKIISLVLALAILAPLAVSGLSLTASASGYNGSGGGSSGGVQSSGSAPGFDESYSGYRVALVDRDSGKVLTSSFGYMVMDLINNTAANYVNAYKVNKVRTDSTNLGIIPQMPIPTSMPLPLGYDAPEFVGQGMALRNWMLASNPNPQFKLMVDQLNYYCFGTTGRELIDEGKAKLIIEMLYQIPLYSTYDSSGYTGYDFYGTFYSSLEFIDKFLAGGGYMGPVVRVAATALYLEKNDLGLIVPSSNILSSIRNNLTIDKYKKL